MLCACRIFYVFRSAFMQTHRSFVRAKIEKILYSIVGYLSAYTSSRSISNVCPLNSCDTIDGAVDRSGNIHFHLSSSKNTIIYIRIKYNNGVAVFPTTCNRRLYVYRCAKTPISSSLPPHRSPNAHTTTTTILNVY